MWKDTTLVPILKPDMNTDQFDEYYNDIYAFRNVEILGKNFIQAKTSDYISYPFVKVVTGSKKDGTDITKLYKQVRNSDGEVLIYQKWNVLYQEVNKLGDGENAQEYYDHKITSILPSNPTIKEISDEAVINDLHSKSVNINLTPLQVQDGEENQEESLPLPIPSKPTDIQEEEGTSEVPEGSDNPNPCG